MENRQVQQFKKGAIEMVLLSVIADEETYGYEIVRKLNEFGGRVFCNLSARNIYPTLHRFEFDGLIKVRTEKVNGRTTCFYSITENGKKVLSEMKSFWQDYVSDVSAVIK